MTYENQLNYPPLWFEVACIEENKLWFIAGFGNGLFEMDLNSDEISFLGMLPNEGYSLNRTMGSIIKVDNKLVMAPFNGKHFYEYDLIENKFMKINCKLDGEAKFFCGKKYGKEIYFIGCKYPIIAKINIEDRKVEYYSEFSEDILNKVNRKEDIIFRDTACIKDDKLIIPSCQRNFVLVFDLITKKHTIVQINDKNEGFNAIIESSKGFWLISRWGKSIVLWNGFDGIIKEFRCCNNEKEMSIKFYGYAKKYLNKVIIFDYYSSNGIIIDDSKETIESIEKLMLKYTKNKLEQETLWLETYEDKIYYFAKTDYTLYSFSSTSKTKKIKLNLDAKTKLNYLSQVKLKENILLEGIPYLGIEELLNNFKSEYNSKKNENYGEQIHKKIKNEIY